MCIKYANLAFKVHLYLLSFSQDKGILSELANELYSDVETAIVNNEIPPNYRPKNFNRNQELQF